MSKTKITKDLPKGIVSVTKIYEPDMDQMVKALRIVLNSSCKLAKSNNQKPEQVQTMNVGTAS